MQAQLDQVQALAMALQGLHLTTDTLASEAKHARITSALRKLWPVSCFCRRNAERGLLETKDGSTSVLGENECFGGSPGRNRHFDVELERFRLLSWKKSQAESRFRLRTRNFRLRSKSFFLGSLKRNRRFDFGNPLGT